MKEGKIGFFRVFIDKEGGIDIEECAFVSEQLAERPNQCEPDPIPQAYFLKFFPWRRASIEEKKQISQRAVSASTFMFLYINRLMEKTVRRLFTVIRRKSASY